MKDVKFKTLKEQYIEMMANKIAVSVDDLTDNERKLIEAGYESFKEKLEEIKILNDDFKRISVELANLKSYVNDVGYGNSHKNDYHDDEFDY